MLCLNPHCRNEVPAGWEGGYCPACAAAIEAAEEARGEPLEVTAAPGTAERGEDPYAEYGFDRPWELD